MTLLLRFADLALSLLHLSIILFCLTGWLIPALLPIHLALVILITLSWFGLASRYGFGYCILTGLQWRVKRRLGVQGDLPSSFIKYALDRITGRSLDAGRVDRITRNLFFGLAGLSVTFNLFGV